MAASKGNAVAAAAVCVLVLLAVGAEAQGGGECVPQLNRLLACRAYAVPGAGDPSAECCSALSSISQGCACSAISIMNSLPSRCHLSQINCSA
uniref:Bifunctional inhibitor/plant lipid transfer protein/seed storage helical domain-containing protein n=1 Tax=Oryza punctata TaxID=4537 RepID=A0A0E0LXM5_ORYPU